MSLQLWTLLDIGFSIAVVLLVQLIVCIVYTIFLVFPVMGKNYDVAVICAGIVNAAFVIQRFLTFIS